MKILYVDYSRKTDKLARKLRKYEFEIDCIDNKVEENIPAEDIFVLDYMDNLEGYDILLAHLGREFPILALDLLDKNQDLRVMIVTDNEIDYMYTSHPRMSIYSYNSTQLFKDIKICELRKLLAKYVSSSQKTKTKE